MDIFEPITILVGFKKLFAFLIGSAAGKAIIKTIVPVGFLSMFLIALAAAGMLPLSPLRSVAIPLLTTMTNNIPYFRYVAFFVPVVPIFAVLNAWLQAVIGFHILKVVLRKGNIIK